MKKPGYTLIELLLSAAIFAGVLMLAFTLVATINRLSRRSEDARQIIFNTSALMDTLTQFTRSASPVRGEHDALCQVSLPNDIQKAGLNGIYKASSNSIFINLRQTSKGGAVSYKTYNFYLESTPTTVNGVQYDLFQPKLKVYGLDGGCNPSDDGRAPLSLLPEDEFILPSGENAFTLEQGAITNGGTIGNDLTLDPAVIGEIPSQIVKFNLTFIKLGELSNPGSMNKYTYQTSVAPRSYQTTLVTP